MQLWVAQFSAQRFSQIESPTECSGGEHKPRPSETEGLGQKLEGGAHQGA